MSTSAAQQFVRALLNLDNIYAEINAEERFLVNSSCTKHESWIITITNLHDSCWEKEIFLEEFLKQVGGRADSLNDCFPSLSLLTFLMLMDLQKKTLGLSNETWGEYLGRLAEALRNDNLFVCKREDDGALKLTIWSYSGGKQLSFCFILLPVDASDVKHKISEMVFDLLALARRSKKAEKGTNGHLVMMDLK